MVKNDEKTYVEKDCYENMTFRQRGTTTHILEAIDTERLALKVKLKQKYYNLYRVSAPLGFVKPGVKKELFLLRLRGKPGKTKLVVEYIASPEGYDPRKPFVEGADVECIGYTSPIQVIIPNLWKGLKVGEVQKINDELKAVLELVTNENKRASPGALTSAYMSAPSHGTSKAKDMSFAFGNTADQLDRDGRL
uniref:Major sperm protein n=1 Tax=Wuchereria bancrofti TaxID=6293 RepID=A0AAF5RXZ6_WUCBA